MSTQQDANSLNLAVSEPAPALQEPESPIVILQRGVIDLETGEWQVDAEVREMNGGDEEYLATIESKGNITYAEYMAALLKRAVVRIGSCTISDNLSILDTITIGDRDILFLGVIKATYGSEKKFQATCPSCNKDNDVVMNLIEDFPVQEPNVNLRSTITKTLKNGKNVKLRLPNTGDSIHVGKTSTLSAIQNTIMLSRCAVWEDSERPENIEEWAKSLNVADRSMLVNALLSITAGPKMEGVNIHCAHCGGDISIMLDWISLLLS